MFSLSGNETGRRWRIAGFAALLALCHALLYAVTVPVWQGPDETFHVEYAVYVSRFGLPTSRELFDPAIQSEILRDMLARDYFYRGFGTRPASGELAFGSVFPTISQISRPPAYPLVGSQVLRLFGDQPVPVQVLILRFYSAVLFALTAAAVALAALTALPGRPSIGLGAGMLIALMPMAASLGGMVNNDNLANLAMAGTFFGIARGERQGYRPLTIALILGCVALGFLTKRTTVFIVPVVALVLFAAAWRRDGAFRIVALAVVAALALGLSSLAQAPAEIQASARQIADRFLANSTLDTDLAFLATSLADPNRILSDVVDLIPTVFKTGVAAFGWVTVELDRVWYVVASWVAVGLLFAIARLATVGLRQLDAPARRIVRWYAIAVSAAVLQMLVYYLAFARFDGSVTQGRYLFVVLLPAVVIAMISLGDLVSARWRPGLATAGFAGLVTFGAIAWLTGVVVPFYS